MKTELSLCGFSPIDMEEAALVIGGLDKRAQDALYTIGYIIGVVARFFVSLFAFLKPTAS